MVSGVSVTTGSGLSKGFTLLELIVVILILSIGMGLLVPQFTSGILANEKKVFLRRLHAALQEARNSALLASRPVYLEFNIQTGSGNEYCYLTEAKNDALEYGVSRRIQVPDYIDIVDIIINERHITTGEVKFIVFPNGLNTRGIINCKDGKNYFHITIKPFARMEVANGKVEISR